MESESVAECFAETVANFTDAIFCQNEILGAICPRADFRQALLRPLVNSKFASEIGGS